MKEAANEPFAWLYLRLDDYADCLDKPDKEVKKIFCDLILSAKSKSNSAIPANQTTLERSWVNRAFTPLSSKREMAEWAQSQNLPMDVFEKWLSFCEKNGWRGKFKQIIEDWRYYLSCYAKKAASGNKANAEGYKW